MEYGWQFLKPLYADDTFQYSVVPKGSKDFFLFGYLQVDLQAKQMDHFLSFFSPSFL